MKANFILTTAIILISCKGASQKKEQDANLNDDWKFSKRVTQVHSYTDKGLLDSTIKAEHMNLDGDIGDELKDLILRTYDSANNLKTEKTYMLFEKSSELFEVKSFEYDLKNRLILQTDTVQKVSTEMKKMNYNDLNQKTEEIIIGKLFENKTEKITPHCNTTSMTFEYDNNGNRVKEFYINRKHQVVETIITTFSGSRKIITYAIGSKGDTIRTINYEKQGKLIAEINHETNYPYITDTKLFDGDKLVEDIFIDQKQNYRRKDTYKYDDKGNEIEHISYK